MMTEPYTALRTRCLVAAEIKEYEVEIDRLISSPSEWQEELTVLRIAQEHDTVRIYLNTQGGYDTTMKAFLSAIGDCKAHTVGIIVGDCSSAGGPIFLACDEQIVKPLSNLMIHTGSSGYSGASNNIEQYAKHNALDNRDIIEKCYEDFITQEEMEEVIKGDDLWMREDEIRERLEKREAIRQQQAVDEAKETYTPEVYATQCVMDITEDCEGFEYDPVDIITKMLEEAKAAVETVEEGDDESLGIKVTTQEETCADSPKVYITEDVTITLDSVQIQDLVIMIKGDTSSAMFSDDLNYLKYIASNLDIKFATNIGVKTLVKRVDDKIAEIRETLVD